MCQDSLQSIHCKPEKQRHRCQGHYSLYTVNLKDMRHRCQDHCSLYTVNLKNIDTGVRVTAVYTL